MTIKFCSFNVRYGSANDGENGWSNRRGFCCELWKTGGWDIVGTQESLRGQIDEIREHAPEYAEVGVGRDDGMSAGEHCAILYRSSRLRPLASGTFWLSETPDVVGSRFPGTRHSRICTWAHFLDVEAGRAFWVYNAHTDHESQPAREHASHLIIERALSRGDADPVVLMGDFNASPDNPAILQLTGPGSPFRNDTYASMHPGDIDAFTYHGFTGAAEGREAKIDYIFASPEWTVDSSEIVRTHVDGRYPSDHFPITATLTAKLGSTSKID